MDKFGWEVLNECGKKRNQQLEYMVLSGGLCRFEVAESFNNTRSY